MLNGRPKDQLSIGYELELTKAFRHVIVSSTVDDVVAKATFEDVSASVTRVEDVVASVRNSQGSSYVALKATSEKSAVE